MGMIGELIGTIAQFVPTWVLAIAGVILLGLLGPGWVTGLRVKRVKAILRKQVRAEEAERKVLQQEAFAMAKGNGEILVALAREADKLNLPHLRDKALRQLEKLGTHESEVRKLKAPPDPTRDKQFGHPVEAYVFIERLIDSGAREGARERLAQALRRFPGDAELESLQARLDAPEPEPDAPPPQTDRNPETS